MALDAHGIIAIVEMVMYVPILIVGVILSLQHGFSRKAGWITLVILATFRIVGGITRLIAEHDKTNITAKIVYTIMESSGISPLLTATLGFLGTICQYSLDHDPRIIRGMRLLGLVGIVGVILGVVGGSDTSSAKSQSDLDDANTLRHVGIILYVILYAGTVIATLFCWMNKAAILKYRRQLLTGIVATLPFLFVRVLYGVLSSFAPPIIAFGPDGNPTSAKPSNDGLGKFSSSSSEWGIYLVMSVLMEYIAVIIYAVVGITTPLSKDLPDYGKASNASRDVSSGGHPMEAYAPYATRS